jgi:hypothetical protein
MMGIGSSLETLDDLIIQSSYQELTHYDLRLKCGREAMITICYHIVRAASGSS